MFWVTFSANQMLERFPVQQFHGDEVSPVSFVNLVYGADVRMVQRRRSTCLTLESFERLWIASAHSLDGWLFHQFVGIPDRNRQV